MFRHVEKVVEIDEVRRLIVPHVSYGVIDVVDDSRGNAPLPSLCGDFDLRHQCRMGLVRQLSVMGGVAKNLAPGEEGVHRLFRVVRRVGVAGRAPVALRTVLSVAEHELAPQVDVSVAVGVVIAIAPAVTTALPRSLVIRVRVVITSGAEVPEGFVEVVFTRRVVFGPFLVERGSEVCLKVIIRTLGQRDRAQQEFLQQLPVITPPSVNRHRVDANGGVGGRRDGGRRTVRCLCGESVNIPVSQLDRQRIRIHTLVPPNELSDQSTGLASSFAVAAGNLPVQILTGTDIAVGRSGNHVFVAFNGEAVRRYIDAVALNIELQFTRDQRGLARPLCERHHRIGQSGNEHVPGSLSSIADSTGPGDEHTIIGIDLGQRVTRITRTVDVTVCLISVRVGRTIVRVVPDSVRIGIRSLPRVAWESVRIITHAVTVRVGRLRCVLRENITIVANTISVCVDSLLSIIGKRIRVVPNAITVRVGRFGRIGRECIL